MRIKFKKKQCKSMYEEILSLSVHRAKRRVSASLSLWSLSNYIVRLTSPTNDHDYHSNQIIYN